MPYREISRKLGEQNYSPNAFKAKVYRAKKAFQKTLLDVFENELSNKGMSFEERQIVQDMIKGLEKKLS